VKIKTGRGCETVKQMKARAKKPVPHLHPPTFPVQEWEVTREPAKGRPGWWHIQARTLDQLSSFVGMIPSEAAIVKTKTPADTLDVFTATWSDFEIGGTNHVTMNIVGKIHYRGF